MPLRPRHGYAADLHRGLPTSAIKPAKEFPARHHGQVRTANQPISTGFELAVLLRGFTPLVPHVHLLVSLAEPTLLSGIQDADEGGVVDADVVSRERPAGGVPAGRWLVRCRRSWARCRWLVDDFADGGACGGFVDEVLAGGERGDEGL